MYSNSKKIRIYHTHIEISPYELGENIRIERMLSVWVDPEFRFDSIGYYINDNVLYIPRGFNIPMLEKEFNSKALVVSVADEIKYFYNVDMTVLPRDEIQEVSIDFLSSDGNFKHTINYSQQALILDTGDGKTYTTIHSIVNLKMKAIIITHQDKIKDQWIKSFLDKTNINENRLVNISGSNIIDSIMNNKYRNACIYFVNHQTLTSYAKAYGWNSIRDFFKKIKVGIKVFDEAHLSFKNVLRIDFFSNTFKTFYLTANFGRSDTKEEILFKRCFSSVCKFGEETKTYEEKRKHIIYVPVLYKSHPNYNHLRMAKSSYGFNVLGFSKYALHVDEDETQLKVFYDIFDIANKMEGKILITVPKIDDTLFIKDKILEKYPNIEKEIKTINSKNSKNDNENAKQNADIICSTIKSCGTGVDIIGLRCIINLEPFSSQITTNQLSGRLREYSKDKDTYFFDIIDTAFESCQRQYKSKLRILRKKCKRIEVMNK